MIPKAIVLGIAVFLGLIFGKWVAFREYPVSVLDRRVINQRVQPGGELLIGLKVDRRAQCDIRVTSYFQFSDRSRVQVVRNYEAGFGPLGMDPYLLKVTLPANAPNGEAFLWSQPQAICNFLEYFFPTTGPITIDSFDVIGAKVPEPEIAP